MPTITQTILQMEQYFKSKQTTQIQLAELRPQNFIDTRAYETQKRRLEDSIREDERNLEQTLEKFDRFPQRHYMELYLLGCARGVAIVEGKYLPELNPNVALEWGWMTGMGREVLFLRESSFKHDRADWGGLLSSSFEWDNCEPAISTAIRGVLPQRK